MLAEVQSEIAELVSDIVSAYVSNNKIEASELYSLIQTVHAGLSKLGDPETPVEEPVAKPTPAQIRKSITPDGLVSFIDGKKYHTLKRHLTTQGLSVAEYKAKFGLPSDYPTTSPSYSEKRSAMAKSMGLGSKGRGAEKTKAPARRRKAPDAK